MGLKFSVVLILHLLTSLNTRADDLVMPPGVSVQNVTASGSGCPDGSVSLAISPDGKAISLIYDKYQAESGGTLANARLACDVKVEMKIPNGYSFTLFSADYRGFAEVEKDALVAHEATYSFYGINIPIVAPPRTAPRAPNTPPPVFKAPISFSSKIMQGPYSGDYIINNQIPMGNAQWSACDTNPVKTLTIGTALLSISLKRTGPHPRSMITLDTIDGTIEQEFDWAWKRCDSQPPVPTPLTAQLYMGENGRDHMLSASVSELTAKGYRNTIPVFKVYNNPQANAAVGLYQCISNQTTSRFVSQTSNCEGQKVEGLLGYIASQPSGTVANRIFRMRGKVNPQDKITVTNLRADPRFGANYIFEVILGYAPN